MNPGCLLVFFFSSAAITENCVLLWDLSLEFEFDANFTSLFELSNKAFIIFCMYSLINM